MEALANPDCGWFYRADASSFEAISGNPIAYWASKKTLNSFALPSLKQKMETRVGMATADNDRFLRCWWEVPLSEFSAIESSRSSAAESKAKWFPYTKGGEYRKWYGNREFVVNWENDGDQIRNNIDPKTGRVKSHNYNDDYAFKPNISWSYLSSSSIHVRVTPAGSLFDSTAGTGFCDKWEDLLYCSSLINSSTADYYLTFLAPTMAYKQGEVERFPIAISMLPKSLKLLMSAINSQKWIGIPTKRLGSSWDLPFCSTLIHGHACNYVWQFQAWFIRITTPKDAF